MRFTEGLGVSDDAMEELVEGYKKNWRHDAACAGMDMAIFFPERGHTSRPAKAVCATCPVIVPCGQFALATNQSFGVWGQMSEKDRRKIDREEAKAQKESA